MNRFEYIQARLYDDETFVRKETQVKLYDGEQKTQFEDGELVLTTHRLFWGYPGEIAQAAVCLCLQLKYIASVYEEQASNYIFGRKTRLILHLRTPASDKLPGPLDNSTNSFIKLSGKHGVLPEFINSLRETLQAKIWEVKVKSQKDSENSEENSSREARLRMRTGIGGIEKAIEKKSKEIDENISIAFQDLKILMGMAKDMVSLSKTISEKIRSQKGEISNDETIRFKSYLLSLGIDDPVTRDRFTNDLDYYRRLADQITIILFEPIQECGGIMSMAEAYCRVNRARGLELLSPQDFLNACDLLMEHAILKGTLPSGSRILQFGLLSGYDVMDEESLDLIKQNVSVGIEDFAKLKNISVIIAKEKLILAESMGRLCRDESMEGLRFYPNFILEPPQ